MKLAATAVSVASGRAWTLRSRWRDEARRYRGECRKWTGLGLSVAASAGQHDAPWRRGALPVGKTSQTALVGEDGAVAHVSEGRPNPHRDINNLGAECLVYLLSVVPYQVTFRPYRHSAVSIHLHEYPIVDGPGIASKGIGILSLVQFRVGSDEAVVGIGFSDLISRRTERVQGCFVPHRGIVDFQRNRCVGLPTATSQQPERAEEKEKSVRHQVSQSRWISEDCLGRTASSLQLIGDACTPDIFWLFQL